MDTRRGGEGPILTGYIGHLNFQALNVSHVHIEERLGLRDGAPNARQGDIGQTTATVHCKRGTPEVRNFPFCSLSFTQDQAGPYIRTVDLQRAATFCCLFLSNPILRLGHQCNNIGRLGSLRWN